MSMSGYENVRDHILEEDGVDWSPAFRRAIETAVVRRRRGVFVPADPVDYTVSRSGVQMPSIDLRGLTDFTLLGEGEGSRIRLMGSGSGASWSMILIGGDSTDVAVSGLHLNGDRSNLTDLDPGQHTHTVQVGGGSSPGFARRTRIVNCTMTDMDGDGVAVVGLAEAFGSGHDVSVLDIIGCRFLSCGRSGVSNQRGVELVRIHDCYFEDTSDADIDFEPTGTAMDSGPRRYSIIGNTFIHTTKPAAVSLSGVAGDIPARDNIFAHNHLYGGRVGMVDSEHILVHGNYIESGLLHGEPVLNLQGSTKGAVISHNHIVRVAGAVPGKTLSVVSRLWEVDVAGFDHTTDTIKVTSRAGVTGTGPVTLTTSGTLPTGLSSVATYFLVRTDARTVRLAASKVDALAQVAVPFTDNGQGRHQLNLPNATIKLRSVDDATDSVIIPAHTRATGAGPIRLTTTGTLPTGLSPLLSYWLIRVDEDTLRLALSEADANAGSTVPFTDEGTGTLKLSLVDHPRDVDVSHNRLHSYTAADDDACTVLLRNGQDCSLTGNEVRSHHTDPIKAAIRVVTTDRIGQRTDDTRDELGHPVEPLRLTADWSVCDNRIRGDAGGGSYTDGIVISPRGVSVTGIKVNGNAIRGCTNRIRWDAAAPAYEDHPTAQANSGDGTDFAGLANLTALRIGGNAESIADYTYEASTPQEAPPFDAPDGSTARRRSGGSAGHTLYVREGGAWDAVATQPSL